MKNYTLQVENDCVALITIRDRSFSAFTEATEELSKRFGNKKIFYINTIDKKGEPFQIIIVFDVFTNV